jgi:hypothetical protein
VSCSDYSSSSNGDEHAILKLMHDMSLISAKVPTSQAAQTQMCNKIRALVFEHGTPSFFVTINPADVYNPIVKFLSGHQFDLDHILPSQVLSYWEKALSIAHNPFIAVRFFRLFIQAFVTALLGHTDTNSICADGILGPCKAYYGTVEAQG